MGKDKKQWKPVDGSHLSDEEAQIAGRITDRMHSRGLLVTAESFFDECRKRGSGGRSLFNWKRDEVAREAWLDRARYVLRSITYTIIREKAETHTVALCPVRGLLAVERVVPANGDGERTVTAYEDPAVALADPEDRKRIIARALAEALNWSNRHEALVEFSKDVARIAKAIEKARPEVTG